MKNIRVFLKSQFTKKIDKFVDENKIEHYKALKQWELQCIEYHLVQRKFTESIGKIVVIEDFDIENKEYQCNRGDIIDIFEVDDFNNERIIFSGIINLFPSIDNKTGTLTIELRGSEFGNILTSARRWGGRNKKLTERMIYLADIHKKVTELSDNTTKNYINDLLSTIYVEPNENLNDVLLRNTYAGQYYSSITFGYNDDIGTAYTMYKINKKITTKETPDFYIDISKNKRFRYSFVENVNFETALSYQYILVERIAKKQVVKFYSDVGYNMGGKKELIGPLPQGVTLLNLVGKTRYNQIKKQLKNIEDINSPILQAITKELKTKMNQFILYKISRDFYNTMNIRLEFSDGTTIENNEFYNLSDINNNNKTPIQFEIDKIIELTDNESIKEIKHRFLITSIEQIFNTNTKKVILTLNPIIDFSEFSDDIFMNNVVNRVKQKFSLKELKYTSEDIRKEWSSNPMEYKKQLTLIHPLCNSDNKESIENYFPL